MQAFADYNDLMDLTEQLVCEMVLEVNNNSYLVKYHPDGPGTEEVEIDFKPPWRRISMISGLEEALGVKFPEKLETEEARVFLAKLVMTMPPSLQCKQGGSTLPCNRAMPITPMTEVIAVQY